MTSSVSTRLRSTWRSALMVLSSAVVLSTAALLAAPGVAQAQSTRPAAVAPISTQQMQPWSGNPVGQTVNSTLSYAAVFCSGSTVYVALDLAQTNQPRATLQTSYKLDGAAPVFAGLFTTNGGGNGFTVFTVKGVTAGPHDLVVEVNNTPAPGTTYYISATANNGSAYPGIPFTCRPGRV